MRKPAFGKEMHHLIGHILPVHDEGVRGVHNQKVGRALQAGSLHAYLSVIGTRDQPRPDRIDAPVSGDDAEAEVDRAQLTGHAGRVRTESSAGRAEDFFQKR